MKSVAEASSQLTRRVERSLRDWAVGGEFSFPAIGLRPPTAAKAGHDLSALVNWRSEWRSAEKYLADCVEWTTRTWGGLGQQAIPLRIVPKSRDAALLATGLMDRFLRMREHAQRLMDWRETLSDEFVSAVRSVLPQLEDYSDADFDRLLAVLDWLAKNPNSNHFVRVLPVVGVDTKWVESHSGVLRQLLSAATGSTELGLRGRTRLVRIRVLNQKSLVTPLPVLTDATTINDLALPIDALESFPVAAGATVLIVENLTSLLGLSVEDAPVDLALEGNGKAGVELARLPWLKHCRVIYWGDLDSHGMEILGRFREHCPHTIAALMDEQTLEKFAELSVHEPVPTVSSPDSLTGLTNSERELMRSLISSQTRLEQERIDWDYAMARIREIAYTEIL